MDGFINVLKPTGMSSHDVVDVVRRIFHQKRVGHAGTLDPAAAG
ncbi:MAG: tRNA pseudouridine(55) synthase TruB, partial [Selenomonas sp.]|nr:tRNA pseudouridine(55) synthase TruB [Selenomonas sp.]